MGAGVAKKKGNKPLTSHTLDGEDYRQGALERLDNAGVDTQAGSPGVLRRLCYGNQTL
jgi:hypothetical protein